MDCDLGHAVFVMSREVLCLPSRKAYASLVGPCQMPIIGSTPARCRDCIHGTYGGQGKAVGLRDTGGFAICGPIDQGGGKRRLVMRLSFPHPREGRTMSKL